MLPKSRYILSSSGGGGGGTALQPINLSSLTLSTTSDPTGVLAGAPVFTSDTTTLELNSGASQNPSDGAVLFFELTRDSLGAAWPAPFTTELIFSMGARVQPATGNNLTTTVDAGCGVLVGFIWSTGAFPTSLAFPSAWRMWGYTADDNRAATYRSGSSNVSVSASDTGGTYNEAMGSAAMQRSSAGAGGLAEVGGSVCSLNESGGSVQRTNEGISRTQVDPWIRGCILVYRRTLLGTNATVAIKPIVDVVLWSPYS